MKKKLAPFVLVILLMSSPLQAASMCPYHWWLGLVALTETTIAYFPNGRTPVRVVQAVATGGVIAYTIKRVYETYQRDDTDKNVALNN